ncbi:unnamed protein product [Rhodiola kirilowii]
MVFLRLQVLEVQTLTLLLGRIKSVKAQSRFPAQVRIRIRKTCKALEEDDFRPVLHHYDGPKFRLELSVPETLDLLDLCEKAGV